jgi:uncharacterized membrane protein
MADALLLLAAFACALCGMASCALSMQPHAARVRGRSPLDGAAAAKLRVRSALGLAGSLALCLGADHVSMAVLVWVMMSSVSAVLLAFLLAYRPRALRFLLGAEGVKARP